MTTDDDRDRLDRERLDADEAYNDALTAFDRIVVETQGRALARDDFDRLATSLILLLQKITAFVETKDRALGAEARAEIARVTGSLETLAELKTQLGVVQRALRAAGGGSNVATAVTTAPLATSSPTPAVAQDVVYIAFEDQFRGSDEAIAARLRRYLTRFAGASDVIDVGCGRGEFLTALEGAGIRARGVDANAEMVAVARARGLDVVQGDALAWVEALPPESIGGAIATQVVEHLEPPYLLRLIDALARALRPNAALVLETINPACWLAFFSSYIRDFTHVRPIHPETLQYLLRAQGFSNVSLEYSAPVPEAIKMKSVDLPADVLSSSDPTAMALVRVAQAANANAAILNSLMFTHLDYAAIGYRA
jgi:SAM-dependent methyltransferase